MEVTNKRQRPNPPPPNTIGLGYLVHPGFLLTTHMPDRDATITVSVKLLTSTRIWLDPTKLFVSNSALNYTIIALHDFNSPDAIKVLSGCPSLSQLSKTEPVTVVTDLPVPNRVPDIKRWTEAIIGDLKRLETFALLAKLSPPTTPHEQDDPGYALFHSGHYNQAIPRLSPLCLAGDPKAQYYMGLAYEGGLGVHANFLHAYHCFSTAVDTLSELYNESEKDEEPDQLPQIRELHELASDGADRTVSIDPMASSPDRE